MRYLKSLFLIGIIMINVACNNSNHPASTKETAKKKSLDKNIVKEWSKQENNDLEIYYPPFWKFDSSGAMGTLFVIYSPKENNEDQFQENINLVVNDLANSNIETSDYSLASLADIKKQLESFNIQEEESININGIDIQKVIFTGVQDHFVMTVQQYYIIHKQKAYILTFTAEETKFDDYIESADLVMNSFKFK